MHRRIVFAVSAVLFALLAAAEAFRQLGMFSDRRGIGDRKGSGTAPQRQP